jgi:cholesterol oxidase
VLERGRRYAPDEFPRDVRDTDALLWRYPRRRRSLGLFDLRFFSDLCAVVASGVGGGSLIYANIHIRPRADVFDDPRWPAGTDRAALDPYYDRVADALSIEPTPPDIPLPKRDAYRAAAGRLGREFFDPDEAVSWDRCKLVAECEFGCPHGAKNSVDLTYLTRAEALGAAVRPHSLAVGVEPRGEGYAVRYRDVVSGADATVEGRRVVLAAGTLGTNELLLRCRDETRALPNVSPRLGHGYSGNGDFLGSIFDADVDLDPFRGPDVTTVVSYFDGERPGFTMAAPTFNRPVMAELTSLGQIRHPGPRWLGNLLWPAFGRAVPWVMRRGLLSKPARIPGERPRDPDRTTFLFAIGQDDAGGRMRMRRGALDVEWDYERDNAALIERMGVAMEEMGREYGGTFAPLFVWQLFRRITTVHSLGGCHLSESPESGVVAPDGEVHGHPGLFVADGSVVPTSIGFHPVMTISALAERTAEQVVRSFPAA